jgi:hypothetical protein
MGLNAVKKTHLLLRLMLSLTLILLLHPQLKAQLILNGDFEAGANVAEASRSISAGRADHWSDGKQKWAISGLCSRTEFGSCDLFDKNSSVTASKVPVNARSFNTPDHSGYDRYAGMYLQEKVCGTETLYGESLIGTIKTTNGLSDITSGLYRFTCWVKLFDKPEGTLTTVGRLPGDYVKLKVRLFNNSTNYSKICFTTREIFGSQNWVEITNCFNISEAEAAYNFNRIEILGAEVTRINPATTIDNLRDDYIFIDDVSLTRCGNAVSLSLPVTACIQDRIILTSLFPSTGFYNIHIRNLNTGSSSQNTLAFPEPIEVLANQNVDITNYFPDIIGNNCYEVTITRSGDNQCCPLSFTQTICLKDCEICDNTVNITYELDCNTVMFTNLNDFTPLLGSYWKFYNISNPGNEVYLGSSKATNPEFTFPDRKSVV